MRTKRLVLIASALAVLALAAGCANIDPIQAPAPQSGNADFTRLVAIGNSLTAGFQNNGLSEPRQRSSYAALMAMQTGKQILSSGVSSAQVGEFVMPGYGAPGSPGTVALASLIPPTILPIENPGDPINTLYPAAYNALAVPGADVTDVLNTVTDPDNPYYNLVLRGQGTMLQQAAALQPTFVVLWIGNGDALTTITSGVPPTPVAEFEADLRQIIETLLALPTNPGLVAGNYFDVTQIPYATTIPHVVVNPATGQPVQGPDGRMIPLIGPQGPLVPGDLVTLGATPYMMQGFGIPVPVGGNGQPLPDEVVVLRAEAEDVRQKVRDYNLVLEDLAAEYDFPIADIGPLFEAAKAGHLVVGGFDYSLDFVTGGLFSLDGIHPTDVGYGLVANVFLDAVNQHYQAAVPLVNLREVMGLGVSSAKPGPVRWWEPGFAEAMEAMMASPIFR